MQVGSHELTDAQQSLAGALQASLCSSRSIHRPAETGLKVTRVHIVATSARRTQYVNGLDMNQTPFKDNFCTTQKMDKAGTASKTASIVINRPNPCKEFVAAG